MYKIIQGSSISIFEFEDYPHIVVDKVPIYQRSIP